MITIKNLKFRYKRTVPLFEDLSLDIPQGSIIGLLGRNGEGKSTLMKLITGQLLPSAGTLSFGDFDVTKRHYQYLQQVFMSPEDMVVPRVTVRAYFDMVAPFYPNYDERIAQEIAQAFEIDWSWTLHKISLGQRKKCLIALAISLRTPILLLDEPTNGLDIPSKSVFRRLLLKYGSDEQTIIISTHQVRDLEQLLDYIIMLDGNRLVCNESIAALSETLAFGEVTEANAERAIYREFMVLGEYGVWKHADLEPALQGEFSMELFFNAMIAQRARMNEVLNHQIEIK